MNITCHPPKAGSKPTYMDGGRRSQSPSPAFRTDYEYGTADASSKIDADWDVVDAPHDFIAEYGNFTENESDQHHGYLPRNVSWYRKHFTLPASWSTDGGATFVHFEGVFHHAEFYLNGKYLMSHECGYTGFDVRLDNASNFRTGAGDENVLALRADASFGSGHWYEGGGIYRPVYLEHVASTHITRDGLFVPPQGNGRSIAASVELETSGTTSASATVRFSLFELDGASTSIATTTTSATSVPAGSGTVIVSATLAPPADAIKMWTTKAPHQYTMVAEVMVSGAVVDRGIDQRQRVRINVTRRGGEDARRGALRADRTQQRARYRLAAAQREREHAGARRFALPRLLPLLARRARVGVRVGVGVGVGVGALRLRRGARRGRRAHREREQERRDAHELAVRARRRRGPRRELVVREQRREALLDDAVRLGGVALALTPRAQQRQQLRHERRVRAVRRAALLRRDAQQAQHGAAVSLAAQALDESALVEAQLRRGARVVARNTRQLPFDLKPITTS
jgi:hypothetical protein